MPTTILHPDDPTVQKAILKKWIVIAEKLFQLRDYNSTIQIINGITEISIMRLEHLKGVRENFLFGFFFLIFFFFKEFICKMDSTL